jgi:nicotinamide phosphoribosyltransferase
MVTDGYKLDHRRQYPLGTRRILSNWTARGSRIAGWDSTILFGLQGGIQTYLMESLEGFFNTPVQPWLDRYQRRLDKYLGPTEIGVEHIRAWHKLGYTPLRICKLPEGSRIPLRIPQFTVENTLDDFFWLTNYYETLLSCSIWAPSTSATIAVNLRKLFDTYQVATGSPAWFTAWQGHDFSMRGMSSLESAILSGMGHLLGFQGSDTLPAFDAIEHLYPPEDPKFVIDGSVAATEHSVMCVDGQTGERETFQRILELYKGGIVSVVSDTWDLFKVITQTLPELKDQIMARDGKLVIRPDSGDPVKIVCGDPNAPKDSPQYKGVVELLWEIFGGTQTDTGHRLLDSRIGVIYGDAINRVRAEAILAALSRKGFASANVVFGVGSYTYQLVTRDVFNFAMKATYANVNGEDRALFKSPATDDGVKFSAKGRLAVVRDAQGELQLINEASKVEEASSLLVPAWEDGKFLVREHFDHIRARALT